MTIDSMVEDYMYIMLCLTQDTLLIKNLSKNVLLLSQRKACSQAIYRITSFQHLTVQYCTVSQMISRPEMISKLDCK